MEVAWCLFPTPVSEINAQHKVLIETFLQEIIDPNQHHFKLFFKDQWDSLLPHISFGHDIEGPWECPYPHSRDCLELIVRLN